MQPNQKNGGAHQLVLQPEPIDLLDTAEQLQLSPKSFGKVVLVLLGPLRDHFFAFRNPDGTAKSDDPGRVRNPTHRMESSSYCGAETEFRPQLWEFGKQVQTESRTGKPELGRTLLSFEKNVLRFGQ